MKGVFWAIAFFAGLSVLSLAYPGDVPETITLNSLVNLYGPVEFSHEDHMEIAEDCTSCHHHSEEEAASCRECHEPIVIYHYKGIKRKTGLGLKGAYHGLCMGCHKESESGPLGCTDCHEKRAKK